MKWINAADDGNLKESSNRLLMWVRDKRPTSLPMLASLIMRLGDRDRGRVLMQTDRRFRTGFGALLSILVAALFAMAALAQPTGGPPGRTPKPRSAYEERLDALLQQRKFADLFESVNAKDVDTMDRALEWLRIELLERGQGSPIGYLYAAQLWRAGATLPGLLGNAYKQAAATTMIMSRWMIATEAFQCADMASPANRLRIINVGFAATDRYYQTLETVHQHEVLRGAFKSLQARYPKRVDDEWLCNGGPQYAAAYAAKHGAAPNAHSAYDPEIRPEIRPAIEWSVQREQALQDVINEVREREKIDLR
jgi:hypothetical protein